MDGRPVVDVPLSIGGLVGVGLSGGFVYWQIGAYAAPQVPRTLFDERKEFFAYTVGLFLGIPLALPLLFYLDALGFGALEAAGIDLALFVVGTEVAQWFLLRTVYFGTGESGAFYALGFRAGASGLFGLAVVTQYLSQPTATVFGFGVALVQAVALLAIEVAAALLSVRGPARLGRLGGSPLSGGIFAGVGLVMIGLGAISGNSVALVGAALAALIGVWVYQRLRGPVLAGLFPPRSPDDVEDDEDEERARSPYRRRTPEHERDGGGG
jgi:hypothetical protein